MRAIVRGLLCTVWIASRALPAHAEPAENVAEGEGGAETHADAEPVLSAAIVGTLYGALYVYTYLAWYQRGESTERLQLRDEGWFGRDTYAGGADKLGHMWTNYALTRGVSGILEWGGYSKPASLLTSTGLALGFFVLIEVKDGYEPQYGFSWSDVAFNVAGNALGVVLELWPALDERFDIRLEYWPSRYFVRSLGREGFFNAAEDYSGQRFLLAYHLASIDALRESPWFAWTHWLDLTLGFRALHYQPAENDPHTPVQELFFGISLNVQQIVERTLLPARGSGERPGAGLRTLRFATEVLAVPFTTLSVGTSRTGTRAEPRK